MRLLKRGISSIVGGLRMKNELIGIVDPLFNHIITTLGYFCFPFWENTISSSNKFG